MVAGDTIRFANGMSTMIKPDRKPHVEETRDITGPGVDYWYELEGNSAKPTDHQALLDDVDGRRQVINQIQTIVEDRSQSKKSQ
jgi:hypothetical protein